MLWRKTLALMLSICLCSTWFVYADTVRAADFQCILSDDGAYAFLITSNYGLVLDSYDASKNPDGRVKLANSYTYSEDGTTYTVGLINKNVFKEQALTSYYQDTTSNFSTILESAFYGATVDENLYIRSITNGIISDGSFKEIEIGGNFSIDGGSISRIGKEAFANARIGGSLTIPKKIEIIEDRAFAGMNLSWFILHDSLQAVGSGIFDECELLQRVILPENNCDEISVAKDAFPNREGLIIQIPVGLTDLAPFHLDSYDKNVFLIDSSLTEDSPAVQYLEANHLHYVRDLSELSTQEPESTVTPAAVTEEPEITQTPVTLPAVTEEQDSYIIADDVGVNFSDKSKKGTNKTVVKNTAVKKGICYRLYGNHYAEVTGAKKSKKIRKVVIPDTITWKGKLYKVKRIKEKAFEKCKKLSTVTIGDYVQTIGARSFARCSKLKKISFGKRVKKIGKKVLYKDKKMKKIIFRTKKLKKIGKKCFYGIPRTVEITVAASKVKAYRKLISNSK